MEEMRKNVHVQNTKKFEFEDSRRSKVYATLCENTSIVTTKIRVVRGP